MPLRIALPPVAAGVLLFVGVAAGEEATRLDALGDPLPPGVVARLGTPRLFQPGAFTLAFSPDGKTLAAVDADGAVRLWDVKSGKQLAVLRSEAAFQGSRNGGPIATFSPDGKLFAVACAGNSVRVWEVGAAREVSRVAQQPSGVEQVAFGRGGRTVVVGCWRGTVQVWDLQKNTAIANWATGQFLYGVVCGADGTVFAVGSGEDAEHPYLLYHGKPDQDKELSCASFPADLGGEKPLFWGYRGVLSPDGALYTYRTPDGKRFWFVDPATGKAVRRLELPYDGPDEWPGKVGFSGDGKVFGAAFPDGMVRLWDAASGKMLHAFKALSTRIDRFVLSADGALVAVMGRADGAIHIWDAANSRELHAFPGHRDGRLTVAFSRDGKTVFTTNRDYESGPVTDWADWSLRRWDAATGKELSVVRKSFGQVRFTSFSPDGRFLAVVAHDGLVHLLDAESGKELQQAKAPTKELTENPGPHAEKWRYLAQLTPPAFTTDGATLFVVGAGELDAWDTGTGRGSAPQKIPDSAEFAGCFAGPDGQSIVVTEWDGMKDRVLLLDAATGAQRRELTVVKAPLPAAAISPEGRTLAVWDGSAVTLWEMDGGRSRGRLAVSGRVESLAFSPDGRLLATGGDGEVRLWRLPSGEPVGRVENGRDLVDSLAFSPDGRLLAVGGWGDAALLCDVAAVTAGHPLGPAKLAAGDLDDLWNDLSGADGEKAYRAIDRLAGAVDLSVPFLKARLQSAPEPDKARIARWIADLDDDDFDVREKASAALARCGVAAQAALRKAMQGRPSAELGERAERLLHKLEDPGGAAPPSAEVVRLRMLEALERSGAPAAVDVLKDLANGPTDDPMARQAKAALERLARRSVSPP